MGLLCGRGLQEGCGQRWAWREVRGGACKGGAHTRGVAVGWEELVGAGLSKGRGLLQVGALQR